MYCILSKEKAPFPTCNQLVGGMRKWMLRQFFLESDYLFLMNLFFPGFRKSSSRMLFMPLRLQWCLQDLVTITTNHVSPDLHHVTQLLPGLRLETDSLPILSVVLIARICLKVKKCCFYRCPYTHVQNLDFSNDVQRGM